MANPPFKSLTVVGSTLVLTVSTGGSYSFPLPGAAVVVPPVVTPPVVVPPVITPPSATTGFFVAPGGNDSSSGSIDQPFATLAKAQAVVRSQGVKTVLLRGGVHALPGQFVFSTPDKGCTYARYGKEAPIFDGNGSVETPFELGWDSSDMVFDGLVIQNVRTSAFHLHGGPGGSSTRNTIRNNTIQRISADTSQGAGRSGGIWFDFHATFNMVNNNLIQDTECCSISGATGGAPESIVGNVVHRNICLRSNNRGAHDTGGIYFLDRSHQQSAGTISENFVKDFSIKPGGPGAQCDDTKGIYLDDMASGWSVLGNFVCGLGAWGFQIHGGDNNSFVGNVFDITQMLELCLYQDDAQFGGTVMPNNSFAGNIVTSRVPFTGNVGERGQPGLWTVGYLPSVQPPKASNNLYWNPAAPFAMGGDVVDASPKTLDPKFRDPANHDYSHTDGGAAVKAAIGFVPINMALLGPQ